MAVAALGLSTACGSSSTTRPAPKATRTALVRLMESYKASGGFAKDVQIHVWSAEVYAADPHFARAVVGLTGGPYGGGTGNTAGVVAAEIGGRWSIIEGPGSSFHSACIRPTATVVHDLVCTGPGIWQGS